MIKGEKFNKAIIKILNECGATEVWKQFGLEWKVETHYGLLNVRLDTPKKRQNTFYIFCKFEEPEKAKKIANNEYSGKWNFLLSDMKDCIETFEHHLKLITGITPTEKVLYEVCKNALGFGSEKSLNRFVKPGVTLQKDLEDAIKIVEEKYNITT